MYEQSLKIKDVLKGTLLSLTFYSPAGFKRTIVFSIEVTTNNFKLEVRGCNLRESGIKLWFIEHITIPRRGLDEFFHEYSEDFNKTIMNRLDEIIDENQLSVGDFYGEQFICEFVGEQFRETLQEQIDELQL